MPARKVPAWRALELSNKQSDSNDNFDVFATVAERSESGGPAVKTLHAKIGQLAMENDFLAAALGRLGGGEIKTMIDRPEKLPVARQCQLLNLSGFRSTTRCSRSLSAIWR